MLTHRVCPLSSPLYPVVSILFPLCPPTSLCMLDPAYVTTHPPYSPCFASSSQHPVLSHSAQRSPSSSAHIIACHHASLFTSILLIPSLVSSLHSWFPRFFQTLLSHFVLRLCLSLSSMIFTSWTPLARFSSPFSITLTSFTHFLFSLRDSTYIVFHHSGLSPFSLGCLLFPYFICNSAHAFSTPHTSSRVLRSILLSLPCSMSYLTHFHLRTS